MRGGIVLLLCLAAGPVAAQAPVKCADAKGRISYSDVPCEKQGLKNAGPIADRTTVVQSPLKPPAKGDKGRSDKGDKAAKDEARPGPGIKPVNPIAEQLAR